MSRRIYLAVALMLFACGSHAETKDTVRLEAATSDKEAVLWSHLDEMVNAEAAHLNGVLGVAILDLKTGRQILLHPDEVFPQASSIKIAVLAELYRQEQDSRRGVTGLARLSDRYVVNAVDLVQDSDVLGGLTPGVSLLTNRDLASIMVAVSDNSATNVLIDRLGMDNIVKLTASFGLPHTQLKRKMMDLKAAASGRENISTPREMMTLLKLLVEGKVVESPLNDDFFKVLSTHKDSWLPRNLPAGVKIANKPGELEGVRADSGVVFLKNRSYVISIMTTYLTSERAGEEAISRISAEAYDLLDKLDRASELGRVISPSNGGIR